MRFCPHTLKQPLPGIPSSDVGSYFGSLLPCHDIHHAHIALLTAPFTLACLQLSHRRFLPWSSTHPGTLLCSRTPLYLSRRSSKFNVWAARVAEFNHKRQELFFKACVKITTLFQSCRNGQYNGISKVRDTSRLASKLATKFSTSWWRRKTCLNTADTFSSVLEVEINRQKDGGNLHSARHQVSLQPTCFRGDLKLLKPIDIVMFLQRKQMMSINFHSIKKILAANRRSPTAKNSTFLTRWSLSWW